MEYRVYEFTETDYHTSNSYTKLLRLVFLHSLHKFDTIYISKYNILGKYNVKSLRWTRDNNHNWKCNIFQRKKKMEKLLNYSYINAMLFLATSYTEAQ